MTTWRNRFIDWLLGIRLHGLENGKSYVLFYTPMSGLNVRHMRLGESGLKDCTVFMQPVMSLDEFTIKEKC